MDFVVTPQPHYIPGYTGHCPQAAFRQGKTYGKLTHKLFVDPCVHHAPELLVEKLDAMPTSIDYPTERECNSLLYRERFVDPVYRHPMVPGYDGFIPNLSSKIGKRFIAAATAGMAEHETLIDLLRCERRNLLHRDLLGSGYGVFEHKVNERLMPMTMYRAPLTPVEPRAKAFEQLGCDYKEKKEHYSKFTIPHYLEADDDEKYIKSGYAGHIPMAKARFGLSHKPLTYSALCDFHTNSMRRSEEWCPVETAGIGSSCPDSSNFGIYHRTIGMVPKYGGHVPGEAFTYGSTYGNATVDAKHWLAIHRT